MKQMICGICNREIVPFEKYQVNGAGGYFHTADSKECRPICSEEVSCCATNLPSIESNGLHLPRLAYRLEILRMLPGQRELDAWAADRQQIVSMLVNADQIFVYLLQIN